MEIGIKALIRDNQEGGKTKEEIIIKLVKYFELTEEEAEVYYESMRNVVRVIWEI